SPSGHRGTSRWAASTSSSTRASCSGRDCSRSLHLDSMRYSARTVAPPLKIFTGSAHPALAQAICAHLGLPLGRARTKRFANENLKVKIDENVRDADVFVVQTSCPPVSEGPVELLIMLDALRGASAYRITAVTPYFPYVRSDKKDEPRISITARLVADLLQTAGADRAMAIDLHSPQVQGFMRMPS